MRASLYFLAATVPFLSGCGSSAHWEAYGDMQVFEAESSDYDYKVYIRNVSDIGINADIKEDREKLIKSSLAGECKSINIIDEKFLPLGSYASGSPRGKYIVSVKCNR